MQQLIVVTIAGLAASLVDGALGMGFGPTSSTLLLTAGLTPSAVALTVNLAKLATGTAGGIAHSRLGNVDRHVVVHLAVPGMIGAVVGGIVLHSVDATNIRPLLAGLLVAVAVRMLIKLSRPNRPDDQPTTPTPTGHALTRADHRLAFVGLIGGLTNGMIGAWGPVVTPILMTRTDIEPRRAVGSANVAEIAVALVSATTLIGASSGDRIDVPILVALLVGGVAAAPLAALIVRVVNPQALGLVVGAMLFSLNIGTVGQFAGPGSAAVIVVATLTLTAIVSLNLRRGRTLSHVDLRRDPADQASHGDSGANTEVQHSADCS